MTDLTAEQMKDRFKNRRRMAWASFILMTLCGTVLVAVGVLFDGIAERINALSFLLGTIFGVWASVILSYFGASTFQQINDSKTQTNEFTTEMDDH